MLLVALKCYKFPLFSIFLLFDRPIWYGIGDAASFGLKNHQSINQAVTGLLLKTHTQNKNKNKLF